MWEMPFQRHKFQKFSEGYASGLPQLDVRIPAWGRYIRVSPRVVNRLPTPVLILNTLTVISSKRQVLPHFHTRKYVIFSVIFHRVSSINFGIEQAIELEKEKLHVQQKATDRAHAEVQLDFERKRLETTRAIEARHACNQAAIVWGCKNAKTRYY